MLGHPTSPPPVNASRSARSLCGSELDEKARTGNRGRAIAEGHRVGSREQLVARCGLATGAADNAEEGSEVEEEERRA
jgi:hypothetical protein